MSVARCVSLQEILDVTHCRVHAVHCQSRKLTFLTLIDCMPWLNPLVLKTVSDDLFGPHRLSREMTASHHPMSGLV